MIEMIFPQTLIKMGKVFIKIKFCISRDYKEYHTDTTVKFVVKMTAENLAKAEEQGLHKVFKLQNSLTTNSMVIFLSFVYFSVTVVKSWNGFILVCQVVNSLSD